MKVLRQRLRTRLTIWYVSVLAGILLLFGSAMLAVLFIQLRHQLDEHAIDQLETLEGSFYFLPDGSLQLRTDYHDHPYPSTEQMRFIEVRSQDATVVYRNEALGGRELDDRPMQGEGAGTYSPRSV